MTTHRSFGIRIKAFTLLAVILLDRTAQTLLTTITTVKVSTFIVVVVIAVTVTFILIMLARNKLFVELAAATSTIAIVLLFDGFAQ